MTYNFVLPSVFFYYPLARLLDWLIRSERYLNTQRNTNHESKKTRAEVDSFFTKPIQKKTPKSSVKTDIFPQNLTFEILIYYCLSAATSKYNFRLKKTAYEFWRNTTGNKC